MNLEQYPLALEKYKNYYINHILKTDFDNYVATLPKSETDIPVFEAPEIPNKLLIIILQTMSNATFYFLDDNNIYVSTNWDEKNGFFNTVVKEKKIISNGNFYKDRISCDYNAIENAFKLLNF